MIAGEATVDIHRPAREVCDFVLDLERYKQADRKIGSVHSVIWNAAGDEADIEYSGRFRGFDTPAVRQTLHVERDRRIDVRSKPGTLAHAVSRFHGIFTFEDLGDGVTRVFHREEIEFGPPLKWLMEPLLRAWLENDTPKEMQRMKALLEGAPIPE